MADEPVLQVEHLTKSFGPVVALRDLSLTLRKGEVLGLLGDNGAGKSTLMKILCGFEKPDGGTMTLRGKPYEPRSVDHARSLGIDAVYQDLALIDELSVFHNMFLRREQVHRPLPFLKNRAMRARTRAALNEIGINIPRLDAPVARLSGGQRQAIAVARTVHSEADILLLDEPLAAMGAKEGARILDLIERLKEGGEVSMILVLHNYVHVLASCDRVNLIQDGVIAFDKPTAETSIEELTELVVDEYRRARAGGVMTFVVGVDFGTLSARALVVDARDGAELGTAVFAYPHGVLTPEPQWALQDPADYVQALRVVVPNAVAAAGIDPASVVGIATDFTASSPLPTSADGTPLGHVRLWKHHAAQRQADRINALGEPWLARYGGRISSEWAVAKALQLLDEEPELYARADRWIEAADWITWQLCGRETRNAALAGYKAIHQDGTYPSSAFFAALDPRFADLASKLDGPLMPPGAPAGTLTPEAAAWTGLRPGIAVAVGNVDAHVTAPAAQAVEPGQLLMIMGTSTCHVMSGERLAEVPGMCGVVRDGIVPGLWGYEAGQTGVGDCFAWIVDLARDEHERLSALAAAQEVGAHGLLALDWLNGNRSVLVDHELSGVIVGLTLATRAEDIYRALVEATAFGTRVILDAFTGAGLPVRELMVAGGLIQNAFVMQVYADVTRMPLHVIGSEQGPALGAAMHAAVAAGAHPDIRAAAAAMGTLSRDAYVPDERRAGAYDALYARYVRLHDHFGRGGDDVLHALRDVRPRELAHG